jgi:hypothetical protein
VEGDSVLLLVTLALVTASLVLLVLGFVQSALGFIYVSMVCAGVAGVALFVFARLAKRRATVLAAAGLALGEVRRSGSRPADRPTREVSLPAPDPADADPEPPLARDEPTPAAFGVDHELGHRDGWEEGDDESASDWSDEVVFPIEDYDDLRVSEILPLLIELEADELQEVRDRETAGKARTSITVRIDQLLGVGGAPKTSPRAVRSRPEPAPAKAAAVRKRAAPAKPTPAKTTAAKATAAKATAAKATAAKATAAKATAAKKSAPSRAKAAAKAAPAQTDPAVPIQADAPANPAQADPPKATPAKKAAAKKTPGPAPPV